LVIKTSACCNDLIILYAAYDSVEQKVGLSSAKWFFLARPSCEPVLCFQVIWGLGAGKMAAAAGLPELQEKEQKRLRPPDIYSSPRNHTLSLLSHSVGQSKTQARHEWWRWPRDRHAGKREGSWPFLQPTIMFISILLITFSFCGFKNSTLQRQKGQSWKLELSIGFQFDPSPDMQMCFAFKL
jgi:hypothetical protein